MPEAIYAGRMSDDGAAVRAEVAKRKIRKFLARSGGGLGQPIVDLRQPNGSMGIDMGFRVDKATGAAHLTRFELPDLDKRILDSVIVECRVFFLAQEDCFLPGVVSALRSLLTREQSIARKPLVEHVAQVVRTSGLVMPKGGAPMYSGRLGMDNGLGPGKLLGTDQIAMDYIYGVALHEDDERAARLANVPSEQSIRTSVILQLDVLLHIIANVRAQVVHDLESGYFSLDVEGDGG